MPMAAMMAAPRRLRLLLGAGVFAAVLAALPPPVFASSAARPPAAPFPGVDAFHAGEGGYACFRLPALLRLPSPDGRSLALYAEGRLKSCSDHAPIDLVYKISRDNGLTWSANVSILCTDGCTTHNGTHDAAYANSTNQPSPVAVAARGSSPGFVVMLCQRGGHLYTSRSLDPLGTAWEPLNDTQLKLVPGPTPGVVLPDGRMVVAAYGQALISDDSGRSWRGSASFGPNGTMKGGEGEVAIAPNGSLLINYRGSHPYRRVLSYSNTRGESWGPEFMPMPELGGSVEGSMITIKDHDIMLTASPFGIGPDWGHRCGGPGRCNMTVWASTDSGAAWEQIYQLNESIGINPREAAAYSSMVQVNSTHAALVYERDSAAHLSLVYVPFSRNELKLERNE